MLMNKRINLEQTLYGIALLLALTLRLLNLGSFSLAEGEASLALQARELAQGGRVGFGDQPAYTALSNLTFAMTGSNNFSARFWPAIVGAALALVPYLFRRQLGRGAALLLSFGLALDAGMVATARLAQGPAMALTFTLFALGLAGSGQAWLAGIFAGMALLSGPTMWPGLLGLGIASGLSWLVSRRGTESFGVEEKELIAFDRWEAQYLRKMLIGAVATILVAGTLFFRAPQGLSAWLEGLPVYLSGWGMPSNVPALRLLVALPVYQPLALVFAIVAAVSDWWRGSQIARFLSLWAVAALTLALAYPARQVSDLVWCLVPLLALASLAINRLLRAPLSQPVISWAQATLLFVLSALAWLNLVTLGHWGPEAPDYLVRIGAIVGVLALGAVSSVLLGLGWSWQATRGGLVLGVCAALGVYGFAGMMWSTQERNPGQFELWSAVPSSADTALLVQTVAEISEWNTGEANGLDVTLAVDSPALRWALRDMSQVTVIPEGGQLSFTGSPSIVITRQGIEEPGLAAAYRGQDFVLRAYPGWEGAFPSNFINWLTARTAPQLEVQVILWVRSDLFPGGAVPVNGTLPEINGP